MRRKDDVLLSRKSSIVSSVQSSFSQSLVTIPSSPVDAFSPIDLHGSTPNHMRASNHLNEARLVWPMCAHRQALILISVESLALDQKRMWDGGESNLK